MQSTPHGSFELIDHTTAKPSQPSLRDIITDCFKGITFYKKEEIDGSSIYVAKMLDSGLASKHNYITLICPVNNNPKVLIDSPGVCLESVQTRILPDYFSRPIPEQVWKPPKYAYDEPIFLIQRSREKSVYLSRDKTAELIVYHNAKRKDLSGKTASNQYPERFSLLGALETWACVVHFKDDGCRFERV